MKAPIIEFRNISKHFGENTALENICLKVFHNEFVTLLGPSGCGKTTLLRILGGFEEPSGGKVFFEGQDISAVPPHKRKINTVFQNYALFPHMDIGDNIAFGLRIKKLPEDSIREKVAAILKLVSLPGFEKRDISSLSGGQQQRIAIARALVNEPEVLLLDEPLGALDLKLRKEMQYEIKTMQQRLGITFIYVTHDQEEALTMSDKIAVMNNGTIQQAGSPEDIYNEPVNSFVADFIGESNIITGCMEKDFSVSFAGRNFVCVDKGFGGNEPVDVVIRPEDINITPPGRGHLDGTVESSIFKGVHYEIMVRSEGCEWMIHSTKNALPGTTTGMRIDPDNIHVMKKGE